MRVNAPPGRYDFAGVKKRPGAFTAIPRCFLKKKNWGFWPLGTIRKNKEKKKHTPLTRGAIQKKTSLKHTQDTHLTRTQQQHSSRCGEAGAGAGAGDEVIEL